MHKTNKVAHQIDCATLFLSFYLERVLFFEFTSVLNINALRDGFCHATVEVVDRSVSVGHCLDIGFYTI